MKYKLKSVDDAFPRVVSEKFGLGLLDASILSRRGVKSVGELKYYLEGGVTSLHSPFLFNDMRDAVERILAAKDENEKVAVFGDRDADGVTSTALIVAELRRLGLDPLYFLPEGDDPYGLTMDAVGKIVRENVTLVITVDCGISNIEEVGALNSQGIDVIVSDHHIAGEALPDAYAILNPKVPSCGYPFMHLAGCGVTAKLIWALRFSSSPLYDMPLILLHAEMGKSGKTTCCGAVKLENLVEKERFFEEIVDGEADFQTSPLLRMLSSGLPIFVLDKEDEARQLKRMLGKGVDISLEDFRPDLEKVIPRCKGKSIYALSRMSRAAMYSDGTEELDTLLSLFKSTYVYKDALLGRDYEKILDYVAIGTIADLMPLQDENRIIVKTGLKQMSTSPRMNLSVLLSRQNLISKPITAQDVAWYVSPVINAAGRLGKPHEALALLLETAEKKVPELTERLLALNKERQKIGEEAYSRCKEIAKASFESFGGKFVFVEDSETPRGLTGSLASSIMKEFPTSPAVMVVATTPEGRVSGSLRSHSPFDCREFLSAFSDELMDYGGHKCAGGFSLKSENLEVFRKHLEEEVWKIDAFDVDEEVSVDAVVNERLMTPEIIKTVELFEPYGEGNPMLTFLLEGATVEEVRTLGDDRKKGHLRLTLKYGSYVWTAIFWSSKNYVAKEPEVGDRVRMIFRVSRNYWRGAGSLQLTVVNMEKIG